jgi:hypothetical protein
LRILVFSCFSGHGEKIVSILVELHSKRKEDSFFFAWKYIDLFFLYMDVEDIKSINVELAAITWTAYESRKILHILQVLYPFGQHKETSRDGLHRIPTCWTAWTATWTASPSTLHAWTALGQQHLQHLDTLGSTLTSYWTAPPRQTAPARDSSCWTATCTTCSTSTLDSTLQHQQLYTPIQ